MLDKLLNRTEKQGDCLVWQGAVSSDGYPRIGVKNGNGKVHRIVYDLANDQMIDIEGRVIRHKCDNPLCINPEHLEVETVMDNVQDRNTRDRTASHLTEEESTQIHSLRQDGFTYQQIADQLGIKYKRVEYVLYEIRRRKRRGG